MTEPKWVVHLKQWLKTYFNVEYFIPNIFVPLLILVIYCVIFIHLSIRYLIDGVNFYFAFRFMRILIYLIISLCVLYIPLFLIEKNKKKNEFKFRYHINKLSTIDTLMLLFPLTPVVEYIIRNQDLLLLQESVFVFAFFLVFCGLYVFFAPLVFRKISSTSTLLILGLAFSFSITSMASLSYRFNWVKVGNLSLQVLFFVGTIFMLWLLIRWKNKKILYIFVLVNFFVTSIVGFINKDAAIKTQGSFSAYNDNELLLLVDERTPIIKPNIYLLVYESYVPNETMLGYGIDNSSQESYLMGQGFEVYSSVYSVGSTTVESLSRVFNASTEFYGHPQRGVSGDGITQNILRSLGYKTFAIVASDTIFRGTGSSYDFSFPQSKEDEMSSHELIISAVLIGEFGSDFIFEYLTPDQLSDKKHGVFDSAFREKVFIYTHSGFPGHSYYYGGCRPNELEMFMENLSKANLEMKQDIEKIEENDPGAIIIVAGDHGPYLTKSCFNTSKQYDISDISRLDIQDRFATFLAIKWPSKEYHKYDEIVVLQDLFPVIFAYMYQDDKILEAKIEPKILTTFRINGATVHNGIINGGLDDGEPLFLINE